MQLDSTYYNGMIDIFESCINRAFGPDMNRTNKTCVFQSRGYFRLEYRYIPNNYDIEIENEYRRFGIRIIDDEKASNVLYRICKHDAQLSEESIAHAVSLLKTVLEKNDFDMYITKDHKIYRKNSAGIKRIKDIRELLND